MNTVTGNLTHDTNNEKAFDAGRRELFNAAAALGREGGTGARSLVKLGYLALRGTYDGYFSLAKPAAVNGVVPKDDYAKLYDGYVKGYSTKDEHGSVVQQVSKLRAFGKAGGRRDIDAINEWNRWTTAYSAACEAEKGQKRRSTEPEYKAMLACANAQIAEGQSGPLTDDQIHDAIHKGEAESPDFLAHIKAAYKRLEAAAAIKADDNAEEAARLLARLIAFEVDAAQRAEDMAKLAELKAKYGTH